MKPARSLFASVCVLFCSVIVSFAQAVVFSDDFSTSTSSAWTTSGAIGTSSFSVTRSGADWGARRNSSPEQLELTNDASASGNINGWAFAGVTSSAFAAPYNPVLNSNPGKVTWTFNMRQSQANPDGFSSASTYGAAVILASNTTSPNLGAGRSGYAVVLGEGGTVDPLHLVRFNSGLQSTSQKIVDSTGLTDFGSEYLSVKVTFTPSTGQWELFVRNDGNSGFSDPAAGTLVSLGTGTDTTYTGTSLTNFGAYWQGSTAANQSAFFDTFRVTVDSPGSLLMNSSTASISESAGTAVLTVNRTGGNSGAVAANYTLSNGSATGGASCSAGVDFINTGGSVSFAAGETSSTISATICNDAAYEPAENFTVTLSGPTGGATIGSPSATTVTISNDDPMMVNTSADSSDGSCDAADCSLRDALNAASNGDTIAFSSLFSSVQTITLTSDLQIAADSLTVLGPGAGLLTINGGTGSNRIFTVTGTGVTISGLKLTGGDGLGSLGSGSGGAIYAAASDLTLDGIYFSGNSSSGAGGAVFSGGDLAILNSTFAGNSSPTGGGIRVSSGTASISNSTLTANTASGDGGAIHSDGTLIIRNSTITGNAANQGGGLYIGSNSVDIGSSIIAGNSGIVGPEIANKGVGNSSGFNLIGDASGDSIAAFNAIAYLLTDITDSDPQFDSFGNWGGTMPTIALRAASPAIDKGMAFGSTADQRGMGRTFDDPSRTNAAGGDGTDIGALERLSPTAARIRIAGRVISSSGTGLSGFRVTLSAGDGEEAKTALTNGFGYYVFDDVEAGTGIVIFVTDPHARFRPQSRFVSVTSDLTDLDLVIDR